LLGNEHGADMSTIESPTLTTEQTDEVAIIAPRESFIDRLQKVPFFARVSRHIPPGKFGRYLLVGIWNTLFGLVAFVSINTALSSIIPYSYMVASILSPVISWTVAYLGYKVFVFKTKGNYLREWLRCVVVYSSSLVLNVILLPILVATITYLQHLVAPGAGGIVAYLQAHRFLQRLVTVPNAAFAILTVGNAIYSFLGHSKFSFRTEQPA
jgi:putative flippase GtrA